MSCSICHQTHCCCVNETTTCTTTPNCLGEEDLCRGCGTVEQRRNGKIVTITKLSANSFPLCVPTDSGDGNTGDAIATLDSQIHEINPYVDCEEPAVRVTLDIGPWDDAQVLASTDSCATGLPGVINQRIPINEGDVTTHDGCTWMSVVDNNTSEPIQGDDTWVCVTKINDLYRCCDSVKEQGEETQVWTVPVDGVNPTNYFVDKPYVTTGEFGCKGDCTTDDTEAFNRAVKFAQDNDVVLVIQGSIRLTNTITINESIQITGASAPELLTVECSNSAQPMYGSWLCYDHMIHGLLFESTDTTVASSVHLSNFGMKRLQQTPANMPYWAPATQIGYDIYFKLFSDGLMRDLVFLNTSLGIKVDKSTRVHMYNTKGQFFARALEVYSADDIKIQGFTSIHYWTKEPAVLEHQRANLTTFVLFGIEHIIFSDIYIKDAYTAISIDVKTSNVNISSLQVSNLVAYGVHTGIYVKQPISDGSFSNVNLRGFDDGSSQKLISIESDNVRLGMLNVVCTQSKNNLLYVSGDNVILAITNFTGVHWDMDLSGDAALYADGVASIMMSGALATYKTVGSAGLISAGDVKTDYAYTLSY